MGLAQTKNAKGMAIAAVVKKPTGMTIKVWIKVKSSFLPPPAKFHYLFNMRELSRVFQGVPCAPLLVTSSRARRC